MQQCQPQIDSKGNHISLICPAECQSVSFVGRHQDLEITDRDRQDLEGRKYLFVVVNEVELDNLGGSHWSLLVMDVEAGIASHYNSLQATSECRKASCRWGRMHFEKKICLLLGISDSSSG